MSDWREGRWYRVMHDVVWIETSNEEEAREAMQEGKLQDAVRYEAGRHTIYR